MEPCEQCAEFHAKTHGFWSVVPGPWIKSVVKAWKEHWEGKDHRYGRDFAAFLGERLITDFNVKDTPSGSGSDRLPIFVFEVDAKDTCVGTVIVRCPKCDYLVEYEKDASDVMCHNCKAPLRIKG